jgi:hypothetical protein
MASESSSAADVATNNSSSNAVKNNNDNTSQTEEPNFTHVPWPIRPSPGINYDFVSTLYFMGCTLALSFYILETQILAPLLLSSKNSGDDDNVADSTVDTATNNNESDDSGSSEEESSNDEGNAWKEFAKGMEGMYFIFLPFIPCFLWSLVVRYFWLKETKKKYNAIIEKKEN